MYSPFPNVADALGAPGNGIFQSGADDPDASARWFCK